MLALSPKSAARGPPLAKAWISLGQTVPTRPCEEHDCHEHGERQVPFEYQPAPALQLSIRARRLSGALLRKGVPRRAPRELAVLPEIAVEEVVHDNNHLLDDHASFNH